MTDFYMCDFVLSFEQMQATRDSFWLTIFYKILSSTNNIDFVYVSTKMSFACRYKVCKTCVCNSFCSLLEWFQNKFHSSLAITSKKNTILFADFAHKSFHVSFVYFCSLQTMFFYNCTKCRHQNFFYFSASNGS